MNGTTTAATISVVIRSLMVSLGMISTSFLDPDYQGDHEPGFRGISPAIPGESHTSITVKREKIAIPAGEMRKLRADCAQIAWRFILLLLCSFIPVQEPPHALVMSIPGCPAPKARIIREEPVTAPRQECRLLNPHHAARRSIVHSFTAAVTRLARLSRRTAHLVWLDVSAAAVHANPTGEHGEAEQGDRKQDDERGPGQRRLVGDQVGNPPDQSGGGEQEVPEDDRGGEPGGQVRSIGPASMGPWPLPAAVGAGDSRSG